MSRHLKSSCRSQKCSLKHKATKCSQFSYFCWVCHQTLNCLQLFWPNANCITSLSWQNKQLSSLSFFPCLPIMKCLQPKVNSCISQNFVRTSLCKVGFKVQLKALQILMFPYLCVSTKHLKWTVGFTCTSRFRSWLSFRAQLI